MIEPDLMDLPVPESFSEREVFAFYGLAAYFGQVLEVGFLHLAVTLNLVDKKLVTKNMVESLFDSLETKTMGQLLAAANSTGLISDEILASLKHGCKKRNYLAHSFFHSHAADFLSLLGRKQMIAELIQLATLFRQTDKTSESIYIPLMERHGLTKDKVEKLFVNMLENAKRRDEPSNSACS